jgi:hypothetical protein
MLRVATDRQPKRRPQSRSTTMRYSQRQFLPHSTPRSAAQPAVRAVGAMRALVLLLILLLLIFVCLMNITGDYRAGGPVLGSVLLIGFGAANYAR